MIPIQLYEGADTISVSIGAIVTADYRKAQVFRDFGIDYCCGGKKTLEEACLRKNLNPAQVQAALDAIDIAANTDSPDYGNWELDILSAHIVERHHRYITGALPMLYELTAKVARVHGGRHSELFEIAKEFNALAQELVLHMQKEEQVLFPYIIQLAIALREGRSPERPFFGTVDHPVRMMEMEHESAGESMEKIRALSQDYTPPSDACTSYRVLFAQLRAFEEDLHQHVHLENNILFPGAQRLEKKEIDS